MSYSIRVGDTYREVNLVWRPPRRKLVPVTTTYSSPYVILMNNSGKVLLNSAGQILLR